MSSGVGWNKLFLRIGHSGAGAHAPPNTLKSIAIALELGVDMVEFDVRPCRDALVLRHDDHLPHPSNGRALVRQLCYDEIRRIDIGDGERIPLASQAIDLIKGKALMNVDLKDRGFETQVLSLLTEKQVIGDVVISSLAPQSLVKAKQIAPQVRTSISYPADTFNASKRPLLEPVVHSALALKRWLLPYRILAMMAKARADAATLHFKTISPAALHRVHRRGGRVYAWTVDDIAPMRALHAMGVDGIASNRPDLFEQLSEIARV
jgi:glycerophosphoryl diester phosphodiesterase